MYDGTAVRKQRLDEATSDESGGTGDEILHALFSCRT
jgi:hypothetical protein